MTPFISICIPAYQRIAYLERLLVSIAAQGYEHYEVIVSDDSGDSSVEELVKKYPLNGRLLYYHNESPLGTPANWNAAIKKAKGEWIKIMHDDDWFSSGNSLEKFAAAISQNPSASFLFSAYTNVDDTSGKEGEVYLTRRDEQRLRHNSLYLFRKNYIGNPSCTIMKRDEALLYDTRFRFVVDFEFYIRYLRAKDNSFFYIPSCLVNVGINDSQVTSYTAKVSSVQVPENHMLLDTVGITSLKNIMVYDHYWRLYRNCGVRKAADVSALGYADPLHPVLLSMIRWQSFFPAGLLKIGVVSKALMLLHYLLHAGRVK